jgi:hypothetical protein
MKHTTIRISIVKSITTIKAIEIRTGEIAEMRCARLGRSA